MAVHVSIAAEKLFDLGPLHVTNSLLTSWVVMILLTLIALTIRLRIKKTPRGLQNIMEAVVEGFYGLIDGVTNSGKLTKRFFGVLMTIFLFVLFNNWLGLLPGVGSVGVREHSEFVPLFRAGSADLSFTLALALIAVILTQYHGLRELKLKYLSKFFNLHGIHSFVGILELASEFSKMISFSFRLFGNVFAGEVLLTVIISLVPYVAPLPFYGLEIFVGIVQAFVFMMLTLVFFKMATVHESH